jgi:hypothetical protein
MMKKIQIILIFLALLVMKASLSSAQVSLNVNINSQPLWGPVAYDHVEYYYMPECDMYYYAPRSQFVYLKGNKWVFSNKLPYQHRNIDLYSTYKVVINESKPYLRNDHYSNYYKHFKQEHPKQEVIRDSRDSKYTKRKNHPNYTLNQDVKPQRINKNHTDAKSGNNNSPKSKRNKEGRK